MVPHSPPLEGLGEALINGIFQDVYRQKSEYQYIVCYYRFYLDAFALIILPAHQILTHSMQSTQEQGSKLPKSQRLGKFLGVARASP